MKAKKKFIKVVKWNVDIDGWLMIFIATIMYPFSWREVYYEEIR